MKPSFILRAEQHATSFRTSFLNRKVAVSRDGRFVAMSGRIEEEDAFVWELPGLAKITNTPSQELKPKARPQIRGNNFLEFIGSSHRLMGDGAKIWDVASNQEVSTPGNFRPEAGVKPFLDSYFDHSMALSSDGKLLLGSPLHDADFNYYSIGLWEVATGQLLYRYPRFGSSGETIGFKYNNSQVSFTPDNTHFYLAGVLTAAPHRQPRLALFYYPVMTPSALPASPDAEAMPPTLVPVEGLAAKSDELPFAFSPDGQVLEIGASYYLLQPEGGPPQLRSWEFQPFLNLASPGTATSQAQPGFINKKLLADRTVVASPQSGKAYRTNLGGQILVAGEVLELEYEEAVGRETAGPKLVQPRVFGGNSSGGLQPQPANQLVIVGDDNVLLVFAVPAPHADNQGIVAE